MEKQANILGWAGAILVLCGYFLNAHHDMLCWPIWVLGNTFVGLFSVYKEAYSTAIMSFLLVILNIYGWTSWSS